MKKVVKKYILRKQPRGTYKMYVRLKKVEIDRDKSIKIDPSMG